MVPVTNGDEVVLGVQFPSVEPTRAASVAEAIARVGDRPAVIEVLLVGAPAQAHLDDGAVTVFGGVPDADAVDAAVRSIEATSAVVDLVATDDGVRFTDLLLLDGEPLTRRPLAERLAMLAEVAPSWFMVERTSLDIPAWADAFARHARERGVPGVGVRLLDAPRAIGDAGETGQVVLWD